MTKLNQLSAWEQMMIDRMMDEREHTKRCWGCPKMGCSECGQVVYERCSSSGGRYIKIADERCVNAI